MTRKSITTLLIAAVSSFVLIAQSTPAEAGRGGSANKIAFAVEHGSEDAIVAEIERTEKLTCPACEPIVLELLSDSRYYVREAAAWWITKRPGLMNKEAQAAMVRLGSASDTTQARNDADLLGAIEMPGAIPVLTALVNRTDLGAEARMAAVRAIGNIGHDAGVPALEIGLADSDATVRYASVEAWAQIRHTTEAAAVAALVNDSDVTVRRAATAVVGKFAEASARTALEDIVINDSDPAVRRNAAFALGQIGDAASRAVLDEAANDSSPLVRFTARHAARQVR